MTLIEVVCRRCGKKAPADEFKVDHIYKLAVCKACYTGRTKDLPKKTEEKTLREEINTHLKNEIEPKKDEPKNYEIRKSKLLDDDEYLERAVEKKKEELRKRKENAVRVRYLKDNKVLYPCQKCNYKFKYDIETKRPVRCPYCEQPVNHDIEF